MEVALAGVNIETESFGIIRRDQVPLPIKEADSGQLALRISAHFDAANGPGSRQVDAALVLLPGAPAGDIRRLVSVFIDARDAPNRLVFHIQRHEVEGAQPDRVRLPQGVQTVWPRVLEVYLLRRHLLAEKGNLTQLHLRFLLLDKHGRVEQLCKSLLLLL